MPEWGSHCPVWKDAVNSECKIKRRKNNIFTDDNEKPPFVCCRPFSVVLFFIFKKKQKKLIHWTTFYTIRLWIFIWKIKETSFYILHYDGDFLICENKILK